MAESAFEKLAGRVAVDKQSARSTFGGGIHYDPKFKPTSLERWDAQPKLQPLSGADLAIVGKKFGKFTVVGRREGDPKKSRWIVRCVCGSYEIRRSKAIENPDNSAIDCCRDCRQLNYLKERDLYTQLGAAKRNELRAKRRGQS